ncbi:MAG: SLC13 family permease [Rhodobacteraceae bacterium]|nr:SLC13 family permease [Paracoccaceae bacterium]
MTTDQILLFVIFICVFGLLLWGRYRYDVVAFGALLVGVLIGVVPASEAFSGFGHPATLVVALVLIVSAGLVNSGAVGLITRSLVDKSRGLGAHIAIMGSVGAVLSAFMNNVAALALLMPVDLQTAKKAKRAAGLSLMPLSFATILGGMVTMIGTPPNIIIATIREDSLGAAFQMFDFAPVGLVAAISGLLFVSTIGWRLIPQVEVDSPVEKLLDNANYIAELTVPAESDLIGKTPFNLSEEAEKADVAIIGVIREGRRLYGNARYRKLQAEDALVLEARPEALDEFRSAAKLDFDQERRQEKVKAAAEGLALSEVVVTEHSRIAGKSSLAIGLNWRQNTILMGISRNGKPIRSQVRRTIIQPGDILLLLTPKETHNHVVDWLGCLPLVERGLQVTQDEKTWLAIGIFAAAVVAASFGLVYLPVALGVVVALFTLTRIVPISEVYTHVEWPVVVLLGSMIPLGVALESSGGTELIANSLIGLTEGMPAWVILTVLMVVTMTLSDVLNNTATTIVAAPVGIKMAESLGVSPDPFLMAVAVAASCAFLTPIGHKNNTLILGPGGYRFGDYWRTGLPLEMLIVAVSIPAILVFWPL